MRPCQTSLTGLVVPHLHHEGVHPVGLEDAAHPVLVGGGPHVVILVLVHEGPHLGVGRDLRVLKVASTWLFRRVSLCFLIFWCYVSTCALLSWGNFNMKIKLVGNCTRMSWGEDLRPMDKRMKFNCLYILPTMSVTNHLASVSSFILEGQSFWSNIHRPPTTLTLVQ